MAEAYLIIQMAEDTKVRAHINYYCTATSPRNVSASAWPCSQRAVLYCSWCTCAGGHFRSSLNIQPIKKINYGLESITNYVGNHLHISLIHVAWADAIFKISCSSHSKNAHIKLNGFQSIFGGWGDMSFIFFMGWMLRFGRNLGFRTTHPSCLSTWVGQ